MNERYPETPGKEFLDELAERARRFGWMGDYVEVSNFVESLFGDAGSPAPDLTPYEDDYEGDTA